MRICTRCNNEMIIDDYMKVIPNVGGDGYGLGFVLNIYKKQHEKGFLKHFLDYNSVKTSIDLHIAFCSNCGMVETFVDENDIDKTLNALK